MIIFALFVNPYEMKSKSRIIFFAFFLTTLIVVSNFITFRIDLTADKRYSISEQTKNLLKKTDEKIQATVYLHGDLNAGFAGLKKSAVALLEEMSVHSKGIQIQYVNPSGAATEQERQMDYENIQNLGMKPFMVHERNKEGKSIRKIIFPWIRLNYLDRVVYVNLLKNVSGMSGEANLNISIENLEFEIADGLRQLLNTRVERIAFIEGHGELNEAETYDISKTLSRYFQIDIGKLSDDASVLNNYKAIIVAQPQIEFLESEKYIIDQYIMNGGRVLWLIEGVRLNRKELSVSGVSPAITHELNLNDMFFRYGVRINPVLVEDLQCLSIPVNVAAEGEYPQFEPLPWYFSPLLTVNPAHPITRNITPVKADFTSYIDIVGESPKLTKNVLLASSSHSQIVMTPTTINVAAIDQSKDKAYFSKSNLPVAVLVEGHFESVFANRIKPNGINNALPFMNNSVKTSQMFIADGDIIRNETSGIASDSTTLPLGFDRYTNLQYGNSDFIKNAVLYLTDESGWMQLRSKNVKLRLLNQNKVNENLILLQLINVALPVLLLLLAGFLFNYFRRKKYT